MGIPYEDFLAMKASGDAVANATRIGYKTVMFGWLYGAGAFTTAKQMTKALRRTVSEFEAQEFIDQMSGLYPRLAQWMEEMKEDAEEQGYVTTMLGRRRKIPFIKAKNNMLRERGRRIAVNTPVQGSAADLMKLALLTIDRDEEVLRMGGKLRLQVHDEVVLTFPKINALEGAERVKQIMMNPFERLNVDFPLPLDVSCAVVDCWADGK
jgi:DNA polymerase-1